MRKVLSVGLFILSVLYLSFPVIIFSLIVFCFLHFKNHNYLKYVLILGYISLSIYQIYSTRIQTNFEFSSYDIFLHQQRLDSYPPFLARMANIIESHIESLQITRFRQNLFNCFDLVNYFKNYLLSFMFFPFILGIINLIKTPDKTFAILLFSSIILLTFIGVDGKYGPVLLLPFIVNIISFYSLEK